MPNEKAWHHESIILALITTLLTTTVFTLTIHDSRNTIFGLLVICDTCGILNSDLESVIDREYVRSFRLSSV